jgi:chemotaxis protein MotB
MKRLPVFILLVSVVLIFSVSCIPGKKFRALQDESQLCLKERDALKAENLNLSMNKKELEAKTTSLEKDAAAMKLDLLKDQDESNKSKEEYNKLLGRVNDLQNAQEDLIKGNVNETRKLLTELKTAQEDLQKKEDLLHQLEQNLDAKKASIDEMNFELEKKNARMTELEQILEAQKKIVQDLKNKVSDALLGFENKGLTVTMKDGKVYVSLDEKLLFKSASWEIDANGRNALRNLAGVLEKNTNIQITIEGHTDNVPFNLAGGQLTDNWDLSVKRATTVVRVLLDGSKIDPKRLTASGRSQYLPVDENNTADARQKNRRTEIILTPDLTELYGIINKY